ncbi:MAG: agmatinase, partial [Thermoprotei archaeon]
KLSHATVMRRIGDVLEFDNICFVGTRAVDREEIEFCRSINFGNFIDADIINQKQRSVVEKKLKKFLHSGDKVLISIDMDVLDPAFAPGVSNPEPLGISPHALMNILDTIVTMQVDVLGFDIVEVSPLYDYGNITSFLASRIIKDMICYLESRNKSR